MGGVGARFKLGNVLVFRKGRGSLEDYGGRLRTRLKHQVADVSTFPGDVF